MSSFISSTSCFRREITSLIWKFSALNLLPFVNCLLTVYDMQSTWHFGVEKSFITLSLVPTAFHSPATTTGAKHYGYV